MRFDVLTLFPAMLDAVTQWGVTRRAVETGRLQVRTWNPRDFTADNHRTVDDRPFGGGPGMVMLAEPLAQALAAARADREKAGAGPATVVLMSPHGATIDHRRLARWARGDGLVMVCGRYEAIDQRFVDRCVDEEASLGDFVLSGGEIAAMAVIDAVTRQLPGVLNDDESAAQDSFADGATGGLLDSPHYTRPETWNGMAVPGVLMSGHHVNIARWRRERMLAVTMARRPDLIEKARGEGRLAPADEEFLEGLRERA